MAETVPHRPPRARRRRTRAPSELAAAIALAAAVACGGAVARHRAGGSEAAAQATPRYRNASASHLPGGALLDRSSMDAKPADLDGDGDLDLVVAVEFGSNVVLRNDGGARFVDATPPSLRRVARDSEDIAVADLDTDGRLDLVFVSEDDRVHEVYRGDGALGFTAVTRGLPVSGVANAVEAADLDADGDIDLVIGNAGQNHLLWGDGAGGFVDGTADALPPSGHVTQDIDLGDVDGDGEIDLVEGNEDGNRVLWGDGTGRFGLSGAHDDAGAGGVTLLPERPGGEETREVDLGDVDGDGDLDVVLANVGWQGRPAQDRLLLNDGRGVFADATAERLPAEGGHTVDADLVDLDGDGDLDIVTANAFGGPNGWRVWSNDGRGAFTDATARFLPPGLSGNGVDVEAADFDGDGVLDLYFANHSSRDILLLSSPPTVPTIPTARTAAPTPAPTATPAPAVRFVVALPLVRH